MKIIFLDTPAFAKQDMIDAFEASHVSCDLFFHPAYNERFDKAFETAFYDFAEHNNYDFVFSLTIFPFYPTAVKNTAFLMYPTSMTAL